MERVGWQPDLPNASVCKGRWRANERVRGEGNYFLDTLKRKVLPS